ncbi:hypothetical protein [Myxococcus qinghaiensis]|uniref:hypothetical protein n=1 Tax=Myxococcus qinghaiensis TaxID=2906758 RepID=UPI0020A73BE8|nr:hypothetical protein [Myxococcus qinghaiensis]MCP3166850.1 hypothetical protein [Myxococcus qinghaiensis]
MSTTKRPSASQADIQSLNIDDLDIEELERRLEMASLLALFSDCYVNTGTAEQQGLVYDSGGEAGTNCTTYCCPSNTVPVNPCHTYSTNC